MKASQRPSAETRVGELARPRTPAPVGVVVAGEGGDEAGGAAVAEVEVAGGARWRSDQLRSCRAGRLRGRRHCRRRWGEDAVGDEVEVGAIGRGAEDEAVDPGVFFAGPSGVRSVRSQWSSPPTASAISHW